MQPWQHWIAGGALVAAIISGSAAWADVPANAPDAASPEDQAVGPVVWNMNQEMSALAAARTPDPEFAPKGIPLGQGGPFRLFTDLVTDASYDDNVYRVDPGVGRGPQSDIFFTVSPTVVLDYQTSFLHLDAYADASFNEYAKLSAVDNTEYDLGLRGTYVISRAAQLSANVSYSQDSQSLSSPNNVGFQARPTLYNDLNGSGQFKYQPNRLGFTLGFNVDVNDFLNTPVIGGGPSIDISYRNDTVYRGFAEGDYDFSPGYEAFLRATYSSDGYQDYLDIAGIHRSSTSEQYDGGVKMLLSNLAQGQIYVGYLAANYQQHQYDPVLKQNVFLHDITGLDYGASLTWFPTELLTLHLSAQRTVADTTIFGASGGDDRNFGLTADYELTRRLHVDFNTNYDDTLYKGAIFTGTTPTNPSFKTFTVGGGAKWLISHYVQATVAYQYSSRSTSVPVTKSVPSFNYNDNLVTVGLNLQI